ncbi:MAG: hypothetical protein LBH25_04135 [Fibromonadaceae bacterium]|nr:hypothetical protein [Fibromonadaceae bacterium]
MKKVLAIFALLCTAACVQHKTVKIGNQVWFAENLNIKTGNSECHENCEKCGFLYDWASALTACPKGWHLPTDAEWTVLENAVGGREKAGATLNEYGFFVPLCGYEDAGNYFDFQGSAACFWSATEVKASDGAGFMSAEEKEQWAAEFVGNGAWLRCLSSGDAYTFRGYDTKGNMFSVRCVQDAQSGTAR